jgi:hypothetical protein
MGKRRRWKGKGCNGIDAVEQKKELFAMDGGGCE